MYQKSRFKAGRWLPLKSAWRILQPFSRKWLWIHFPTLFPEWTICISCHFFPPSLRSPAKLIKEPYTELWGPQQRRRVLSWLGRSVTQAVTGKQKARLFAQCTATSLSAEGLSEHEKQQDEHGEWTWLEPLQLQPDVIRAQGPASTASRGLLFWKSMCTSKGITP